MADNKDIRKYINILKENKKEKVLKEDDYPDANDVATGNETKVEVEFKDGDQVEVEVYAQGMDQLKRLMDLAGIFHKDKQSGALSYGEPTPSIGPESEPVEPAPLTSPEPEMPDMGIPELPGTDVPADIDMDAADDEVPDKTPELDFDMDTDPEEEGLEEARYDRFDYGHPNPNLGQESYELEASNYSGLASKPNRYVQAKHGDNPMADAAKAKKGVDAMDKVDVDESEGPKKGLKEYMDEVNQEKKDLDEVDPEKVGELVAKLTPKDLSAPKQQAISQITKDLERDVASGQRKVTDLNPEQVMGLITSDQRAKAAGMAEPEEREIEGLAKRFGDEFEEKRQYSFKQSVLPFQGLTGVQRIRRNALRAMKKKK